MLCTAWGLSAEAQNTVESIRKEYQNVHEWIARMIPDSDSMTGIPPEYYDLSVVQNLPGTGPHRESIRMYFEDGETDEEGAVYPPHCLRFLTASYNFAAFPYYEEYLYDANGQVSFIYAVTPDAVPEDFVPYELRMYFEGDRLLRFTAKRANMVKPYDFNSLQGLSYTEKFSGTAVPRQYVQEADRCILRAKRFLHMFKGIDDNTYK